MKKRKVGRPSKYNRVNITQLEKLCRLGATDKEIAGFYDVDEATINRWKLEHPEFCESLKRGKTIADMEVADRLYQRAIGYEHAATKIMQYEGAPVTVPYTEHYPPDTTAAIFWLKNRQSAKWRDKQELDVNLTEIVIDVPNAP